MDKLIIFLKKYIFLIFGIIFLLAFALVSIGNKQESDKSRIETDERIEREIQELQEEPERQKEVAELQEKEHYNENVETSVVNGQPLTRTDVYERLSGVIRNERIGLKEPIYKGASEVNMRKGVATLNVEDSLEQKLLGISGHRSPVRYQYFSEVPNLVAGDIVYIDIYDENGKVKEIGYKVTKKYNLTPDDRETLDKEPDVPTLRLVTCDIWNNETKSYDERMITEAVRID